MNVPDLADINLYHYRERVPRYQTAVNRGGVLNILKCMIREIGISNGVTFTSDFETISGIFQIVQYLVFIIGIPITIYKYITSKKREQYDREYGTYDALDREFKEYSKLCIDHPDLDVSGYPNENPPKYTPAQKKQERIMFSILCSLFERAYLMFKDTTSTARRRRWTGWIGYFHDFSTRDNFRSWWKQYGGEYDTKFVGYFQQNHLPSEFWTNTRDAAKSTDLS